MKLGKDVISTKTSVGLKFTKPKRTKTLGRAEKEILWTLYSLGNMKPTELQKTLHKSINTSLGRLHKKQLVEMKKGEIKLTEHGRGAILHYAIKGQVWTGYQKIPKVKSIYKMVLFDLDDTLIPGFVTKKVDVETMRKILQTLRKNGIKTSVLSINADTVVYERLRNYGLLKYIDIPFQTSKTYGIQKLLKFTQLKPEEVLFVGHDIGSDFFGIKSGNVNVPVALFKDAVSSGDSKTSIPKVEGLLVIPRDLTTFVKVLEGKIRETPDKKKLMKQMRKRKPAYVSAGTLRGKTVSLTFTFLLGDIVKILGKKAKKDSKKSHEKGWYNKELKVVEKTPLYIRLLDENSGKTFQLNRNLGYKVKLVKLAPSKTTTHFGSDFTYPTLGKEFWKAKG